MINARVETVAERASFRAALERYRCLIVADGFYEWQRTPAGPKQGHHIARADGALFAFAGLWSIWHGPDGTKLRTCTILTTAAAPEIASLHDRMPIILAPEAEPDWLGRRTEPQALNEAALPASELAIRPVGPAVNDARYDGPDCLDAPVEAQPSLF